MEAMVSLAAVDKCVMLYISHVSVMDPSLTSKQERKSDKSKTYQHFDWQFTRA